MTKTAHKPPHFSVLNRMSNAELKSYFMDNVEWRKLIFTRGTEYYISTRYEVLRGNTKRDLWNKFRDRVRNRTDISVFPYVKGRIVQFPVKNRGERKFFTAEQFDKALDKYRERFYNGISFEALSRMFKCDVFHEKGRGFFWYPAHPF